MKEDKDVIDLVNKSKESLEAARYLFNNGFFDFSASRSYYAMFYATEAVLLTKNLVFSRHKSVIAAFGKDFIKSAILPKRLHSYFVEAFDLRQKGDYGPVGVVSKNRAERLVERTKEFVNSIREYLQKEGYQV